MSVKYKQIFVRGFVVVYAVMSLAFLTALVLSQSTHALTQAEVTASTPVMTNPTNGATVTDDLTGNQMLVLRWNVPNSTLVNDYLVTLGGFTYTTSSGYLYTSNYTQGTHTIKIQSRVGSTKELGGAITASFTIQNARPLTTSLTISGVGVSWGSDGRLKFNGNFRDTKFASGTVSIVLTNDKGGEIGASGVNLAYTSAGQEFSGTVTGDDRIVPGNIYAIRYYGYNQLTRFDPPGSVIEQTPLMYYCFMVGADHSLSPANCPAGQTIVVPSVLTSVTLNPLTTTDKTPLLTGTVDSPTAIVTLTINGIEYVATNNGDGTWSYQTGTPIAVGATPVKVIAKEGVAEVSFDGTIVIIEDAQSNSEAPVLGGGSATPNGQSQIQSNERTLLNIPTIPLSPDTGFPRAHFAMTPDRHRTTYAVGAIVSGVLALVVAVTIRRYIAKHS